ncbi:TonB family protein [Alkalimarinus sediminis]|uniref:TonB family protein n=1 Tax=Alkalimarinus sediminis TaxID=1632866 RepID=A0A9E8HKD4_9ALTE|nr:TonB family protein [Alkalimarinus sediminis]UZW75940.1 TonB family protein [Alkalimarinus sediminis]
MKRNKRSHVIFLTLLSLSILLHVVAWSWLDARAWLSSLQANTTTKTTVEITLQPSPIYPQQEELDELHSILESSPEESLLEESLSEEHPTQHNADSFASSNNTDKSVRSITPGKPTTTKQSTPLAPVTQSPIAAEPPQRTVNTPTTLNTAKSVSSPIDPSASISNVSDTENQSIEHDNVERLLPGTLSNKVEPSQIENALSTEYEYQQPGTAISEDMLAVLGNMELLDDHNLSGIDVKDPYSKIESQRIKMVNRYLQRMEKQIKAGWVKPKKTDQQFSGVIKFTLTPYGQLTDAYIYLGSGHSELDQSALAAVKQVKRFAVPESALVAAKYYSSLRFQYSSHDFSGETIPLQP